MLMHVVACCENIACASNLASGYSRCLFFILVSGIATGFSLCVVYCLEVFPLFCTLFFAFLILSDLCRSFSEHPPRQDNPNPLVFVCMPIYVRCHISVLYFCLIYVRTFSERPPARRLRPFCLSLVRAYAVAFAYYKYRII